MVEIPCQKIANEGTLPHGGRVLSRSKSTVDGMLWVHVVVGSNPTSSTIIAEYPFGDSWRMPTA